MPIKGTTKNIALPPILNKDIDSSDNYIPFHVEIRNLFVDDTGNTRKRNGYTSKYDSGIDSPVWLLIPELGGIAGLESGRLFYHLDSTPTEITGTTLSGSGRPRWVWGLDSSGNPIMIVVAGGSPIKISKAGTPALLAGSPPSARFIGRIGAYTLFAGYNDFEMTYSAASNSENVTTGDSGTVNVKKTGKIVSAIEFKNQWIVFKENEAEVWYNRGGSTPFVRLNESLIPFGCGAAYSVVEAESTLFWLDPDKKFRSGGGTLLPNQDGYMHDKLNNIKDVYGIHCRLERCIRWFSPVDGLTLTYYYEKQSWVEDNHYEHGEYERLPWNSYMELNGRQYFGDYRYTGLVHEWDKDYKNDNGDEIRCLRQFKVKLSEAGNLGSIHRLRLMIKSGVDTATETQPQVLVRWKFDDNAGDTEWLAETIDLNLAPNGQPYYDIYALGLGRVVEFQIIQNDSVDFVITGMFITVEEKGV